MSEMGVMYLVHSDIVIKLTCVVSFFFFSSRRRHTRFDCDWSSDVCSSDLAIWPKGDLVTRRELGNLLIACASARPVLGAGVLPIDELDLPPELYAELRRRSEERRVGKECRSRWSPYH